MLWALMTQGYPIPMGRPWGYLRQGNMMQCYCNNRTKQFLWVNKINNVALNYLSTDAVLSNFGRVAGSNNKIS